MDGAFDIDVEDGHFAGVPNALHFGFECAVVFAFVHHFPFYKFFVLYFIGEVFFAHEIIIHSVFFIVPWFSCGRGNGESQFVGVVFQQVACDAGFSCTGGCCQDDDLLLIVDCHERT